jgi:molecular chaperone GrpE
VSDNHNPTQAELDAIEAEADALLEADAEDSVDPSVLDAVAAERDEWKDRALRVAADMENLKRRSEVQQNDARAFAIQRFAKDLLPVADALQRAIQAAPKDSEGPAAALVAGLEMVEKSLQNAFASNALKQVAPGPGDAFDPHFHDAMMEQPSDTVPGGAVLQTMQPGYELFGRTIRPAMVVVAAKGSGAKAPGQGGQGQAAYAQAPEANGAAHDSKA